MERLEGLRGPLCGLAVERLLKGLWSSEAREVGRREENRQELKSDLGIEEIPSNEKGRGGVVTQTT